MKRFGIKESVLCSGMLFLAFASSARADVFTTISIGPNDQGPYSGTLDGTNYGQDAAHPNANPVTAGAFGPANTVGGDTLTFLYCLSLKDTIALQPQTYSAEVNQIGDVKDYVPNTPGGAGPPLTAKQIDELAYIVKTYNGGVAGNTMQTQEALWAVEYGARLVQNLSPADALAVAAVVADAAANGNSIPPGVIFINPYKSLDANGNPIYNVQSLIGFDPNPHFTTPVPGTLVMSCIMFGMGGAGWSFKRLNRRKMAA